MPDDSLSVRVRAAQPEDESSFRRLWSGYLAFYEADVSSAATDATWRRIHDGGSPIFARVACVEAAAVREQSTSERVVGFAVCIVHDNTWSVSPLCYLEDLFVDASIRGRGVGRALLNDLIALAEQNGWSHLYWHTRRDNAPARRLYDSFVSADEFVRYRIAISRK
jgi:ribosomal protein S18 acetylase RimI-like enzyme